MTVELTHEAARLVAGQLARGEFHSAAEVLDEALRALQERDDAKERERIEALVDEAAGSESVALTADVWAGVLEEASALAKSRRTG
jgi:putative addiction module CopG family antidote